jgi:parallel beta-helix repeat protein
VITTVSNTDGLWTALKNAHAGDTILLAAGTYSAISLTGFNFTGTVTVQSADPTHQAVINGLTLTNSSGISFNHIDFAANGGTAVTLYSSQNIAFDATKIHGAAVGDGNGMMIRDSSAVSVTNSDLGKLGTGINELNSTKLTVSNNTFHDIQSGAIRGSGDTNEVISGNQFVDGKATVADHSDVIQLWQDNTANNVAVTGNTYGATAAPPVVTTPPPATTTTTGTTTSQTPPTVVTAPPSGSVTVTSSAALVAALKVAHAGDTILLAPGTYSAASLTGFNFSTAVTIQSADSAHQAVINGLTVTGSSGLSFNHVDFAANGGTAVTVMSSQHISFDSVTDHGAAVGDGNGMMIRDSSSVSVTNSDIGKLGTGINELNTQNLTLSNNTFHDIQNGDIRGSGDTNETISGNAFLNGKATVADHSDVIQLWQDNTANHVTITNNTYGATTTPTTPVVTTPPPTTTTGATTTVTTPPVTTTPTAGHTVTVTNSDALWSALTTAHNGDTILLAPGSYAPITLQNFNFSGTVTVQSADSSNLAVLNGLKVINSSGLTFNNFDMPIADANGTGAYVLGSQNITLSGLQVHGTTPGLYAGLGAMVRDSSGVTITASDFTQIGSGIAYLNSDDVTLTNNNIHNIQTDGMVGSSTHMLIQGNTFSTFHPAVGDHPDAIQFFGAADGTPSSDIVISDNVIVRGAGDVYQGIFTEATNNITITGNAMTGTMYNGISVYGADNALIQDNFVQGYTDMGTRIIVRGQSSNVTVVHNVTQDLFNYQDNGLPNPNYVASDNTSIPPATLGDVSAMNAWLALHTDTTITGTSGSEALVGAGGDDILNGLGGADTMSGGFGDDTYIVDNAGDVVTEALNAGLDTIKTALTTYTLQSNVENLTLTGSLAQSGFGNGLDNVLTSNGVAATLNGGAGNDTLVSNGGTDVLTGGAGNDTFYFQKMPAAVAQITDFTHGQDTLDLHTLLGKYLATEGTNPLADQWVKFTSDSTGTTVYVDADGPTGSGGFVAVAKLVGVTSISSSDWIFH